MLKMSKDIAHRTTSYIIGILLACKEQRIYDGGQEMSRDEMLTNAKWGEKNKGYRFPKIGNSSIRGG